MIETRQQLNRIEATSFPNMKEGDRRKVVNRLQGMLSTSQLISDPKTVEQSWKLLRLGKFR